MSIRRRVCKFIGLICVCTSLIVLSSTLYAQSADQLADRVDRVSSEWLQNIDRLQITNKTVTGMLEGMESTTVYEKVNRDGVYILEAVQEEGEYDIGEMTGFFDGKMGEFIRHASSIDEESFNGYPVYRIHVDDSDFLRDLDGPEQLAEDELEEEFLSESATLWLDRNELVMHRLSFNLSGPDQQSMTVHIQLSDYQNHAGLPIPHVMEFEIEGLDQMISDEELEEARRGMRELEEQLAQMPEAQRQMIEEQLRPQIEQFEQMLEQGELGNMRIEVTDVRVN